MSWVTMTPSTSSGIYAISDSSGQIVCTLGEYDQNDVSDIIYYLFIYDNGPTRKDTSSTSNVITFDSSGMVVGNTYRYQILYEATLASEGGARKTTYSGPAAYGATTYFVYGAPPPPADVSATAITPTTATITWSPSYDASGYELTVHDDVSGINILSNVDVSGTSYTLSGLIGSRGYTVSVKAKNSVGLTPVAGTVAFQTDPYAIPNAPIIEYGPVPISDVSANVRLYSDYNWGADYPIDHYEVDVSDSANYTASFTSTTPNVVLGGLTVGHAYTLKIRAYNPGGFVGPDLEVAYTHSAPAKLYYDETTIYGPGALFDGDITTSDYPTSITAIADDAFNADVDRGVFTNQPVLTAFAFRETITSIGDNAFLGTSLTSVSIPNLANIGTYAFADASGITSITIGGTLTTLSEGALASGSIKHVELPNSVATLEPYSLAGTDFSTFEFPGSLTDISDYALADSSGTQLLIPASVQTIGYNILARTYGIRTIFIQSSTVPTFYDASGNSGSVMVFDGDATDPLKQFDVYNIHIFRPVNGNAGWETATWQVGGLGVVFNTAGFLVYPKAPAVAAISSVSVGSTTYFTVDTSENSCMTTGELRVYTDTSGTVEVGSGTFTLNRVPDMTDGNTFVPYYVWSGGVGIALSSGTYYVKAKVSTPFQTSSFSELYTITTTSIDANFKLATPVLDASSRLVSMTLPAGIPANEINCNIYYSYDGINLTTKLGSVAPNTVIPISMLLPGTNTYCAVASLNGSKSNDSDPSNAASITAPAPFSAEPSTIMKTTLADIMNAPSSTAADIKSFIAATIATAAKPLASLPAVNVSKLVSNLASGADASMNDVLQATGVVVIDVSNNGTISLKRSEIDQGVLYFPGAAGKKFTMTFTDGSSHQIEVLTGGCKVDGVAYYTADYPRTTFKLGDRTFSALATGSFLPGEVVAPGPVVDVSANVLTSTSVRISWPAVVADPKVLPATNAATAYKITILTGGNTQVGPVHDTSSTSITISTGLTAGTTYTAEVSARNDAGRGIAGTATFTMTVSGGGGGGAVPCFLGDAPVLTPTGYQRMDSLKEGDMVLTGDGRAVAIQRVKRTLVAASPAVNPYVIPRGRFGATKRLLISPNHRVQVEGRGMIEARELGLRQEEKTGQFVYYNLELPEWGRDTMVVAGVVVESLAPVRRVAMSMGAFKTLLAKKYGAAAASPEVLQKVLGVCRMLPDGRVEAPIMRNA